MSATHKLVPVEPTAEMKRAGSASLVPYAISYADAAMAYRAMIEAAPAPPADLDPTERERVCKVLGGAQRAITAAYDQVDAEFRDHDTRADKAQKIVRAWQADARALLDQLRLKKNSIAESTLGELRTSIRSAVEQEIVAWLRDEAERHRGQIGGWLIRSEIADAISSGQYRKERG